MSANADNVDLTQAPGGRPNDVEVVEAKVRPTVRQLLTRYRSLGLPGHKKARRARRIAVLQAERDFMSEMVRRAALLNAKANSIIRALIDENNFATFADTDDIHWVADDTALENARKYLAEFKANLGAPKDVEHVAEHRESHPAHESVEHVEALPS